MIRTITSWAEIEHPLHTSKS